jgi:hypothetical protein
MCCDKDTLVLIPEIKMDKNGRKLPTGIFLTGRIASVSLKK